MISALLEDSLGFNISRAGLLVRRELMRALAEYKMTPEQWMILISLWSTGTPLNQSEIVQLTLKDKHTVSRIIQRLERDGWIKKKADPNDARVTVIQLTKKGISFKDEVPATLYEHFDKILKDFDDHEIELLIKSLKKLRSSLGD